jgi:hypothetical protein
MAPPFTLSLQERRIKYGVRKKPSYQLINLSPNNAQKKDLAF